MGILLIVDDNRVARLALRVRFLKVCPGWEVREAPGFDEALAQLELDPPPDLITVDRGMPSGDGLDLVPMLQRRCPTARIAMVTADAQSSVKERASALGVPLLIKPVADDALLELARAAFERS